MASAPTENPTRRSSTLRTLSFAFGIPPIDQIDKTDLTAFVVAQKKEGQDDRAVANRVAGVVTFLRAHGITNVTIRHKYTEKK